MSTTGNANDQHTWTALGVRMGFTSGAAQRTEILHAIDRMTWSETPAIPPHVVGPAIRTIVTAIYCGGHLSRVGIAQLDVDRQLIGLEDTLGTRHFVLDLDAEAISVLTEIGRPMNSTARRQPRVA